MLGTGLDLLSLDSTLLHPPYRSYPTGNCIGLLANAGMQLCAIQDKADLDMSQQA